MVGPLLLLFGAVLCCVGAQPCTLSVARPPLLMSPRGLASDPRFPGRLCVSDALANVIRCYDTTG